MVLWYLHLVKTLTFAFTFESQWIPYEVGGTDIMFIFADEHKRPNMLMPEPEAKSTLSLLHLNLLFHSNISLSIEEGAQRKNT